MCLACGNCSQEHIRTIDDSVDNTESSILFKEIMWQET